MGLFGGLSKSKGKSSTESEQTRKLTETVDQTGVREQVTVGEQLLSSLPEPLQELLGSAITAIGSGLTGEGTEQTRQMEDIMSLFGERALTSGTDIAGLIEPRLAEARRTGERELSSLESRLAREAGGSMGNTFVTAATAEGRAGLESMLASQGAELGLQARALQTQELGQALQALGISPEAADVSNFAQLLEVLKGATVAQTSRQEVDETTEQNLKRIIDEVIKGTSETKTKSSGFKLGFG